MAVYSVAQVLRYLNEVLGRDSLVQDLWVRGEVSDLRKPGSGHSYFSLRDSGTTLRCVLFRRAYAGVDLMADLLADGSAVVAHGRITIYQARGDLQFIVDMVRPEGVGELQLKLEQLKMKLGAEGLFEPSRKRPLPPYPRRVAVVTSPGGAVWQDIQTVVKRRYPLVELVLAPAPVQGEAAARGIVDAFDAVDRLPDVDVAVVARGGGSLEDLWPFNEEAVARAIFASQAPVISAIGHETDLTIADMVADRRAPTPSAAAEMAVPDQADLIARLSVAQQAITASVSSALRSRSDSVSRLRPGLRRLKPDLDGLRLRIDDLLRSVVSGLRRDVEVKSERAGGLRMRLESLSPRDTLRRGYAIVQRPTDESAVVSDAAQVATGDPVRVTLARGGFGAEVTSVRAAGEGAEADAEQHTPKRSKSRR